MDLPDPPRSSAGRNWIDLVVAFSVILISITSLIIALRQSKVMEQQLSASVWPYLQFGTSNQNDAGAAVITLDLENAGTGPALLHSLTLLYDGKPLRNAQALLDACCKDLEPQGHANWTVSTVHDQVMAANRSVHFLSLEPTPGNERYWQRLNVERNKLVLKVCFCSVLNQCWMLDSRRTEREAIQSCAGPQATDYDG